MKEYEQPLLPKLPEEVVFRPKWGLFTMSIILWLIVGLVLMLLASILELLKSHCLKELTLLREWDNISDLCEYVILHWIIY